MFLNSFTVLFLEGDEPFTPSRSVIVPEVRPNERHSKDTLKLSTRFLPPRIRRLLAPLTSHLNDNPPLLPHESYARAFEHVHLAAPVRQSCQWIVNLLSFIFLPLNLSVTRGDHSYAKAAPVPRSNASTYRIAPIANPSLLRSYLSISPISPRIHFRLLHSPFIFAHPRIIAIR